MRKLNATAAIIISLMTAIAGSTQTSQGLASDLASQPISVTVDGIAVSGQTTFLPPGSPGVAQADSAVQVADWSAVNPFRELSIAAIRYGHRSYPEAIATASSGTAATARAQYVRHRLSEGAPPTDGPIASLFGQKVVGLSSVESIVNKPSVRRAIVEWFVEAQNRVWIVRALEEVGDSRQIDSFMKAASGVALDVAATNVAESTATTGAMSAMGPSRVKGDTAQRPGPSEMRSHTLAMATEEVGRTSPNAATGDYPSWWSGACDDGHYYSATTWWHHSVALGPNYLGMPACGPLPNHVAWPDYQATFYPGAVTQVAEFECVELTKRFLYLTYHTGPYAANGNQMVQNYTSAVPGYQPFLAKVQNGTVGQAPQPGDILELGQGTAFGHTAIATSSSVDFNGNGTIWVIEENGAASGSEPWTVSGWWVQGSVYAVNEWLHLQSINLTSTNLSFSVPQGSGGSQSGPTAYLSGNYTWEIRVTGSAGNFTYKYWAPGTNALFLAPDPYYTTTINLVGSGTAYQFYGTVCGQSQGCATLSWGPITLGGDNYTAWSQLYRT